MTHPIQHLAARIFGVPLAIHPTKGKVIVQALAGRLGVTSVTLAGGDYRDDEDADFSRPAADKSPDAGYDLVDGVAVINISGTLVHRLDSIRPYSGMLGYNAIRTAFLAAMTDSAAKAITLLCNSPGGEVSGCFDLVDTIFSARGEKPITAICDDMAFSACYAIASAADSVVVPRTGGVGSVGVITMHADFSQALKGQGVAVTIFQHGDRKSAGSPYRPLSGDDSEEFQAHIDSLGDLFDNTVARNRGMTVASIKAMQARTYMGAAGVDVGLADAMLAPDEAFRVLLTELG